MPRLVDHEQRRQEIADAGIEVALEQGLAGITIRGISARTGRSTGSLRHYFPDQEALRKFVIGALTNTLRERVYPRIARPREATSLIEHIASILEVLIPLDETRREEYALWSTVVEWERTTPEGGSQTWREQRALHRQCAAVLCGHERVTDFEEALTPHPDPEVERRAALLHTFVDGLAAQVVDTPHEVPVEEAKKLLREFLVLCSGRIDQ